MEDGSTGYGGAPGDAAEDPVIATAQDTSGSVGSASYTFNDGVLTVSGSTFTGTQWSNAISNNSNIKNNVTTIVFENTSVTGDATQMSFFSKLKSVGASGLNVSQVTNMKEMFHGCVQSGGAPHAVGASLEFEPFTRSFDECLEWHCPTPYRHSR
jgi:hypothetical protein